MSCGIFSLSPSLTQTHIATSHIMFPLPLFLYGAVFLPQLSSRSSQADYELFKRWLQTAQAPVDLSCRALKRLAILDTPLVSEDKASRSSPFSVFLPRFELRHKEQRGSPQVYLPNLAASSESDSASCPAWLLLCI